MSTKTVQTPYGDTTIEVVECDSCGNEVAKDDTLQFTLGDREGRACEHCYETGPISYPERVSVWARPKDMSGHGPAGYIIFFPLLVFFVALDSIYEEDDYFANGFTVGVIATLIWLVVLLLGYNLVV